MSDKPVFTHSLGESIARASRIVERVLAGKSLNAAMAEQPEAERPLKAAAQDLAFDTLRGYGRVDALVARLVHRPLESELLYALLLVAVGQLEQKSAAGHAPVHTLVDQAVEASSVLGLNRARGLVNAVLRAYLRRERELDSALQRDETARYRYPQWWIDRVKKAYPGQWAELLEQGNIHPPMTLRINRRRTGVDAYLAELARCAMPARALGGVAVLLERPCPVERLPGFFDGAVSVQDAGAQRAAQLLDVQTGMKVLDACAAPGGKTAALLEQCDCVLTSMDLSVERLRRIEDNLARLGLHADIVAGDAREAERVFAGRSFDRILLDAPCTASGVVRRHPDIRWLRRESDIGRFAALQAAMLESLWRVLAVNGKLLYATCSVFPEENGDQVSSFLERHPDARRLPLSGIDDGQIMPSSANDGFFYALLSRSP